MARIRTVDFLPEIFRTNTNKKFLNSTLDQLVQEPKLKPTQGYIGRRNAPGALNTDGYVSEPSKEREHYQLEPGIVFKDKNGQTIDALTYLGLINGLKTLGSEVSNHDRLFRSETYSWNPLIDFDKFVNYSQYVWLPNGPDAVDVIGTDVYLTSEFNVSIDGDEYIFERFSIGNPIITLRRNGSYKFNVNQPGNPFYIQAFPGTDGTVPWSNNISSRDVYGVQNNGEDNGTIIFNVPSADAQSFYSTLTDIGEVDLATFNRMDSIADKPLTDVSEIEGIYDFQNKTIVFLDDTPGDAVDLGWVNNGTPLTDINDRYQIYRIQFEDVAGTTYIRLVPIQQVQQFEKFTILYGVNHSGVSYYKNSNGYFERIPLDTASLDTLYYQDGNNPNRFGVIKIVDDVDISPIDISEIEGKKYYTSPNGVVFSNGLKVKLRGNVIPEEYVDKEFYVEGVGESIKLLPTVDYIVPEKYTKSSTIPWDIKGWDIKGWDGSLNAPEIQDYITINRASPDLNAWSRSNRWFHVDILEKTAEYNNTDVSIDNDMRGKRPIIEFDPGLRLFNHGTRGKKAINVIDFEQTDAMSYVNGAEGYAIDGYSLNNGSRVIFANDTDPSVRDKIFVVEFVDTDGDGIKTIRLVLADDAQNEKDDVVVIGNGVNNQGKVFTFDGNEWIESQLKSDVNQPPLFDIFDIDGNSFSDLTHYPSTNFKGTKLFSYAIGNGTNDSVLGFPLKYLNIGNLGDIVFDNNLYTDTFNYVEENKSKVGQVKDGYVRKYTSRTDFTNEIGWVKSIEKSFLPQVFTFEYNVPGAPFEFDITPRDDLKIPSVVVTVNGDFLSSDHYVIENKSITFDETVEEGSIIEIKIISDEVSSIGHYDIPVNLSRNVFNENTSQLTLGTIRNHYIGMVQNIIEFEGRISGSNNSRDLGNIEQYGNFITQQSAPLALTAMFMRNKEYNFFAALKFASRQYEKIKFRLIDWVEKNNVVDMSPAEILDAAIKDITQGKNVDSPFYWSDMLPFGSNYDKTIYEITPISTNIFTTLRTHDFEKANSEALLVYYNDKLLIKDIDYVVATDGPRIEILFDLTPGDIIEIREFESTAGSTIPSTPTKLGLYPKYKPEIFEDNTYLNPTNVIRGHDGSITVAFNDIRDDVLLEFEKRIYNNIKVNDKIPIIENDIIPGVFRDTDYTLDEIQGILNTSLLSWLGWNKIEFRTQNYRENEPRSWNYNNSVCKLENEPITKGFWRGVYNCFYDTDAPHERPWEMLGLSEKPLWWEERYGPAPYTSGNLVLWDDLEQGLIKEPGNERIDDRYVRPGLTTILPVDGEGNLLPPIDSVVGNYSSYDFKKSWKLGDEGPAETAWKRSSAYRFDLQRLFALTKPAEYFSLMADRDRYVYDEDFDQYLYDKRHRLDARNIELALDGTVKHSYINWILEYNRHYGFNTFNELQEKLSNLDVNLCHHMASFTGKNILKIFVDKNSPDRNSGSLLLPDESYSLLLYKNQPYDEIIFSSVIVQKVNGGYSVTGNSLTDPYFIVQEPEVNGKYIDLIIGETESDASIISIPTEFTEKTTQIPYGHIFKSREAVASFLVEYGEYLKRQGLKFNTQEEGQEVDWVMMAKDFGTWASQGWAIGSIINLNPSAKSFEFEREQYIVENLKELDLIEQPLNQNKEPLSDDSYVIDRIDNNFKISIIDDNVINYIRLNLVNFEHLLILDNESIFGDLIYNPVTGIRQQRVKLSGFTTYDWNGQLDAQGFLYNEDNIQEWSPNKTYNKGDIVKFKNIYWSATEKVQPSDEFNFNQWTKTNYDDINKGLLPNLATKADQQLQFYNNKTANLESDADLLAFGLIGYRTRDYMQSLNLDDISQVNIYSNMIKNKGTVESLELFQNANLNNEPIDYKIFENWAIRRAAYGATSNRLQIDLQLNENELTTTPSTIEIVNSLIDESAADQKISVDQIYRQSEKISDKNIFPLLEEKNLDISLPSAGSVLTRDVDLAVFDITEISGDLTDGTFVWVAKDSLTDWNVYRVTDIEPKVIFALDNLDGTLSIEFDQNHNLDKNNIISISNFDEQVDGTHIVIERITDTSIKIEGSLAKNQTIIENQVGDVRKFISSRIEVPSDIAGSIFDNQLFAKEKVWIDNDHNKAATYEKIEPFVFTQSVKGPNPSLEYGFSVAQAKNNAGMLVGDPSNNTVYFYDKLKAFEFAYSSLLNFGNNPAISRYGESIDFIESLGVVGAPGTDTNLGVAIAIDRNKFNRTIVESHVIVSPNQNVGYVSNFGQFVNLSGDEKWLFIGEPSENKVHAYEYINYENQSVTFKGDGHTKQFKIDENIVVDPLNGATQLIVSINGNILTPGADYVYNGTYVILQGLPPDNTDKIEILRRDAISFIGDGAQTIFNITDLYAFDGEDSVVVTVDNVIQIPKVDYQITTSPDQIIFTNPVPAGKQIIILLKSKFRYKGTIDGSTVGVVPGDNFGASIDVSNDGTTIIIGAPQTNGGEGAVYVFDRIVERFIVIDKNNLTYTANRTPNGVLLNGRKLNGDSLSIDPDFEINGNDINFLKSDILSTGDIIDIETKSFGYVGKLVPSTVEAGSNFGEAISLCNTKCSVYIGAPGNNGFVTRFINRSRIQSSITSTLQNPTIPAGTIRINNIEIALPASNNSQEIADVINNAIIPNVKASANNGYLTIELVNKNVKSLSNRLDIQPGQGIDLSTLGLETYTESQIIVSPVSSTQDQHFGKSLYISDNFNQLIVGANNGNTHYNNNYTADTTKVTADELVPADSQRIVENSGVVYSYDLLDDGDDFTLGKLVFGQQIVDTSVDDTHGFGKDISLIDGVLVITSPGYEGYGRFAVFYNSDDSLSWVPVTVEKDVVDIELIDSVSIYNKSSLKTEQYLDYIDPLNGKILGVAAQNLDFITVYDPAVYDNEYRGSLWSEKQIGKIWWDISNVRFMNYNVDDIKEASKVWGKVFPGSSVDVYQWIESDVPPSEYQGTGSVYSTEKYVTKTTIGRSGVPQNTYYYWVNRVETVSAHSEKTLSADAIASYIESPNSSGIAYVAFISSNQIGLYNCKEYIKDKNSILRVEYNKTRNDNNVFIEYDLFKENNPDDFLSDRIYRKLQDSLCGVDILGNLVPDVTLTESERYGIDFRPRQSMFIDRFAALKTYMEKVNSILRKYTIAETHKFTLLNTEEPVPPKDSGEWDEKLLDVEELSYQDLTVVPVGYKYLIEVDTNNNGLWTIYEVTSEKTLRLARVQSYDTKRFWEYVNWYDESFDPNTKIDYVVDNFTELSSLTNIENNAIGKVLHNSVGNWEIYKFVDNTWTRVALENGTIQFLEKLWNYQAGRYGWDVEVFDGQYLDEEPVLELRQIIRSINEEIFIGNLAFERNKTILTIFNYILAEQPTVNWLFKTSLIDVTQNVRSLAQYAVYQEDNQNYLLEYIKEAKPYHTKIRDFLLTYNGIDTNETELIDFDCPAYYDVDYKKYISPILDDGAILVTDPSNKTADDGIWQTKPWNYWFENYHLGIKDIVITNPGRNYSVPPKVVVNGNYLVEPELIAKLGPDGTISKVEIINPGSGFVQTPTITFEGGNGYDAAAIPIMGNDLVRSTTTRIKYDRYEYESNVVEWEVNKYYKENQLVRVSNVVYKILIQGNTEEHYDTFEDFPEEGTDGIIYVDDQYTVRYNWLVDFDPALHELVDIETLSGIDRTTGFYVADVNNPGLDLSLLINGIAFPGVEVDSIDFDQNTGFDVSAFDNTTFDNFDIGPEGLPTYSESLIDTIYESSFLDPYLGTRPTDIDVDGGAFIDTYHSHAPEELIPGMIYDTLDIKVYSRPGADYRKDGHGFNIVSTLYDVVSVPQTFSFDGLSRLPISILVANTTTGKSLYEGIDFTVDWSNQSVNITSGISINDTIKIFVYEVGGGNQLYRGTLRGSDVNGDSFTVPVKDTEIYDAFVRLNGITQSITISAIDNQTSLITLPATPANTDFITVVIFGYDSPQYRRSYPKVQTFVYGTDTLDVGGAIGGKNKFNAIVEVNGLRLRPPEAARYIADGLTSNFVLPQCGGYLHDSVAQNEVDVWVNDTLLREGLDFTLSPPSPPPATFGSARFGESFFYDPALTPPRYVILNNPPAAGDKVDVYVRHAADYWWNGSLLQITAPVNNGDLVAVTTFRDVREQDPLTEVFVGPKQIAEQQLELFDSALFDSEPFDLEQGVNSFVNIFDIDREEIKNPDRLWVTLNGRRLLANTDYEIINENQLLINGPPIANTDVVTVTSFTDNIVTDGVKFRLFKDMRDNVGMYKFNEFNTTYLTQDFNEGDDIIHVNDASVLEQPNLSIGRFGIIMIGGERITYRERDLVNNTISGLRRGTAGTAIKSSYPANTIVTDVSRNSLVRWDYDKIWYEPGTQLGDENAIPMQDQNTIPIVFIKN